MIDVHAYLRLRLELPVLCSVPIHVSLIFPTSHVIISMCVYEMQMSKVIVCEMWDQSPLLLGTRAESALDETIYIFM